MKKIIFLTVTATMLMLAASCGETASTMAKKENASAIEETNNENQGTIHSQKLTAKDIPGEIGYQGDIIEAYKYTDKTGENIVIFTETDVMAWYCEEDEIELSSKSLYAHRFLKKGNDWEEIWRVYDMELDCPVTVFSDFIKDACIITDLNDDGVAEIWLIYKKGCFGGLDVMPMFLRMYHNEEVYTISGETKLEFFNGEKEEIYGGEYTLDNKFLNKNTPPAFVNFAKQLWEKNIYGFNNNY